MITDTIRQVLADHGNLAGNAGTLGVDDDLYDAGLTSLSTVTVMLALEDALGVEFPEEMLSRRTFASVSTIRDALGQLLGVS